MITFMSHTRPPIVLTVLAVIAAAAAAYVTVSTIGNASDGVELTARGVGFPVLLWFLTIVCTTLAAIRWWQRRRYLLSATPEERARTALRGTD
jgi:hypothetical protein